MKNYGQHDQSPAKRFQVFCEKQGLTCRLLPCIGRQDRFHSKMLVVNGRLIRIRRLCQPNFYYKLHPTTVAADFVAYAIPDSTDEWLIVPFKHAQQSTMFSLTPDLDRATYSQRHDWKTYVNNVQQLMLEPPST